ncbi:MAG: hypothetical protein GY807_08295 [Gammaproteobacteria bacterium]|nr:hypothetical protein [Gammaproteobacteria bacterium]
MRFRLVRRTQGLQYGFTHVELLIVVTIAAVLVMALMSVVGTATGISDDARQRNDHTNQAHYALQRMVRAVSHSRRLLLPLNDNPNTNWPENIREQTVPQSPPVGDSTRATAVLAVTLPLYVDLDANGTPDADNDGDGLIDEDLGVDNNFDAAPGIHLIDDNGDGTADDSADTDPTYDNDEDDVATEETMNGLDDDGDGSIDEDLRSDMNNDGDSGVIGVDDDSSGAVDEDNKNDDDEDGQIDEDWYDSVVFYLDNGVLKERTPVPWDTNADTLVTGADYITSELVENVSRFRVERIAQSGDQQQRVELTLELTSPITGEVISLQTQVRVGGAL